MEGFVSYQAPTGTDLWVRHQTPTPDFLFGYKTCAFYPRESRVNAAQAIKEYKIQMMQMKEQRAAFVVLVLTPTLSHGMNWFGTKASATLNPPPPPQV